MRERGFVAVGSEVDSPRDDQGRQIGGVYVVAGRKSGLVVMVLLDMRGANQIWNKELVVALWEGDDGQEKTISKLYAGLEAHRISEPGCMKGTDKLTG